MRIGWPGVITDLELLPTNVGETEVAEQMLIGVIGIILGDQTLLETHFAERLHHQGLELLAPNKSAKRENAPWPTVLKH